MNTSNRIQLLVVALVTAVSLAAPSATAVSYAIGLSPRYNAADAPGVLKHVLLFVLEDAAPGDDILVYDALHQQPVTRFTIPEGRLFQNNARARVQRLASSISKLRSFLEGEASGGLPGVIDLPQFLDLAGPQLRAPGEALRVIVVASPLYLNPQAPSFNMDDAFPSDAHLKASQSDSVFGTALRRQGLSGVTVHYACLEEGCFVNDYHRERVGRFWALFIARQQGTLATFAPDLSLAFRRAAQGVGQAVIAAQLDAADTKIQMLPVHRRPAPRWLAPTNEVSEPPAQPEAPGPELETLHRTELPVQTTQGQIGIGIMWSVPVDCDLWVKAHPAAGDLFFRNRTTPEGRYFHDYRSANEGVDYEYVELKPTDLGEVKAWVNLYEGSAPAISGVVVVRLEGRTYRGEFRIEATRGNGARDRERRDQSRYWTELDLLRIVGLHPATTSTGNR